MAETVNMPKLGFDMAEGTLLRWVINEGEEVKKAAILAEIETDKATVEVESAYEGIMARHLVAEGDVVPVNTPIAVIAAPGEKVEAEAPAAKKEPAEGAEPKAEAKVEQVEGGAPQQKPKRSRSKPASHRMSLKRRWLRLNRHPLRRYPRLQPRWNLNWRLAGKFLEG